MKKIKIITLTFILSLTLGLGTNAVIKNTEAVAKPAATVQKTAPAKTCKQVNPLDIVAHPSKYLNKKVTIKAQFDKFTTLGLDYKPAFRSSEKYITFLIKRSDVINQVVPLSEMKNFLKRDVAEKYIDLDPGDMVEYTGTVFSNALSDVWIDVEEFKVLEQKKKTTDKK